jgi:hypothetical protein
MEYLEVAIINSSETKWIKDGTFRLGDPRQRHLPVIGLAPASESNRKLAIVIVFKKFENEAVYITAYPISKSNAEAVLKTKNFQQNNLLATYSEELKKVLRDQVYERIYPNSTSAGGPGKAKSVNFKNSTPPPPPGIPLDGRPGGVPNPAALLKNESSIAKSPDLANAIPNANVIPDANRNMNFNHTQRWDTRPFFPVD